MSAPLSNRQKAYLTQLADRAFNRSAALARGRGESPATDSRTREAWRHDQVALAAGRQGLRCCSQDDYKRVEAHFLDLLGAAGQALNAHVRAETEPRRVAEWKVVQACNEFGLHLSYADKICRSQNRGLGLEDVDEKALWRIVYTLRNRGHARQHALAA